MDLGTARHSSPLERWLWRLLARSSDHMVACSEALAVELRTFLPGDAAKIRAIHNGLDPASFFASRDVGAGLDPRLRGRPFILSVAAYEPKKGLDVLIRAFHLCKPHWSRDVALVRVGGERGVGPQLGALAIELGLGSDVFFLGALAHAQLTAYFEAATLFCLPSRMEPFGIVLLEAGAFARAVVASRVGGIPEIITDGETGRLVAPEDPVELSRVLLELMGNTAERDRLGAALRARVTAHFSWTRACRAYLDLCR
jgi:starch synthase